ncbi:substrate-binding domain-containing protein [Rhodoblastus acidophilus]|uniref:Substrate-binding domain-containing protein n=1 Tax=Candidatus Rhodoblastus alkanivorans TaxID=2954117 RepID=A0ABS9Z7B9_9HYPH|nr:substrate-binding domain-containing protein [Candidatus Rhodoblastus alkanivorans]MCI4678320.1 substrate-binding domain-containing protein [Candidatus Rhodoblastus alkanivorans]MCI4683578.1 substrate-binding domain-containing protein [Candidatus Rhodoblastus alkanivorans]MDI4640893.1 substrate-binding domain-containing protein [Rhodoblastus acidophilus]
MSKLVSVVVALVLAAAGAARAGDLPIIYVYGPGGPAPAMKEAAQAFGAAHGVSVVVAAGPTPKWVDKARADADILYTGAENMMRDYAKAMPRAFDPRDAEPLYLRPVAILVRPGNPKGIHGFRDLLKPGVKVLTVAHAGQVGLWEDVAGRTGEIDVLRAFRRNMVWPEAPNSAAARDQWMQQTDIDAWLIWNIWQVANPHIADLVPVEEPFRIYRDTGVVLTRKGAALPQARAFVDFLKSKDGRAIFVKWGWEGR